jgi:hypothetical protein
MRQIYLLFWILTINYTLKGQIDVPSKNLLKDFLKTKTCFVIDDNPFSECNIQLKSAAEKFWKLTPFEIIGIDEFEKRRFNKQYSFVSIDEVYFDNTKNPVKYKFLSIYLGGNYKTESNMPQICNIPLAYLDEDEANYCYKTATLLIFAQNHILTLINHPELKNNNIIDYYLKNKDDISKKTLLIVPDDIEPQLRSEKKFSQIYPYNFKFTTHDEIEKAIDNKDPDVIFLHKVGTKKNGARIYKAILDTKNAQLYYFDYHIFSNAKPDALLESDIKKLISK